MAQPGSSAAGPARVEEESEDESDILAESPCGRWQKRQEQVRQENVYGIESTYLAMDTEEGVEVAWHEVHFTDPSVFHIHEENIKLVFEHFMQLEHPNIVKFHKYWIDSSQPLTRETPARETTREPPTREPPTREPSTREPSTREPPTREPSTREPSTREPSTREPPTREPSTREPSTREPSTREPPTRETPTREPSARETPTKEPSTRETSIRETSIEETSTGETSAGETSARETSARETSAKETSTGETSIRVIFITEYLSSGSLKQFLNKTKKNRKAMHEKGSQSRIPGEKDCSRWHQAYGLEDRGHQECTRTPECNGAAFVPGSSPLFRYLHSWEPPLIHGTLTCDTIFIQHNGLIKIGSVWLRMFVNVIPTVPRTPLRSPREEQRNRHFFAPEYEAQGKDTTALDIFAFGICALEMAVLEVVRSADNSVSPQSIATASQSLENTLMKEFIQQCLAREPSRRPTAHDLLFHRVLFEVHSLKLLAAHSFINNQYLMQDNCVEEMTKTINRSAVMAEIRHGERAGVQWTYSHVSTLELDKFLEDVKNGIYPLMTFSSNRPHHLFWAPAQLPETTDSLQSPAPEPHQLETRKVIQMQCHLELHECKTRWHVSNGLI
uniref:nuclear receptor-binding protein 2-like n=1 Tax=Pristiophorus japonicus TaxID=55135 RepID=UPI00398E9B49